MGFIYIRTNNWYDSLHICKLGRASNIKDRETTYITSEPVRGKFILILYVQDEIYVESLLKTYLIEYHVNFGGGTEFYSEQIISLICDLLDKLHIYHKITDEFDSGKIREKQNKLIQCKPNKIQLRDYQMNCIDLIMRHFTVNNRADIVWACGLGKTRLACEVTKHMNLTKILIGVPNVHLQSQFANTMKEYYKITLSKGQHTKYTDGVIIATYHSMKYLENNQFDIKIADESHHLGDDQLLFSRYDYINAKYDLRLTATPQTDIEPLDYKSYMFGVNSGYLTDFRILLLEYHCDTARMLLQAMKDYNITHPIYYTNTVESSYRARNLILELTREYDIVLDYCELIIADTKHKHQEIKRFAQCKIGIIFSVYVLGEGFDEPKIDAVMFGEHMTSQTRILQTAMRCNRLHPDKIMSYIMLPYTDIDRSFDCLRALTYSITGGRADESNFLRSRIIKTSNPDYQNMTNDNVILRLCKFGALYSIDKLSDEYTLMKHRVGKLNIKTKEKYYELRQIYDLVDTPDLYFGKLWINWADYLSIDYSMYYNNKHEWLAACINLQIYDKHDYEKKYKLDAKLPYDPTIVYNPFGSITRELQTKMKFRK